EAAHARLLAVRYDVAHGAPRLPRLRSRRAARSGPRSFVGARLRARDLQRMRPLHQRAPRTAVARAPRRASVHRRAGRSRAAARASRLTPPAPVGAIVAGGES